MPPDEQIIEHALECLGDTTVNSFTASPSTINPGSTSTLSWDVTPSQLGCNVRLFLNGSPVEKSGSISVAPTTTTGYTLVGKMYTVQGTLGRVAVNVDTNQCVTQSVDEETVRQLMQSNIEASLAGTDLSQRSPAVVEIDRNGITVKLRLKLAVNNFFDPDVNIDMLIGVFAENYTAVVRYLSYSDDVDWPWWVTGITLAITEFVDNRIEDEVRQKLKPLLLQRLQEQIDSYLSLIPSTHRLQSLTTEADEIKAMVCRIP